MQVQKEKPFNPIMQDTKKGALRYYTYGASFFNYGMLPQTWEDPAKKGFNGTAQLGGHGSAAPWGGLLQPPRSVRIGTVGDNDPLDGSDRHAGDDRAQRAGGHAVQRRLRDTGH